MINPFAVLEWWMEVVETAVNQTVEPFIAAYWRWEYERTMRALDADTH